MNRDELKKRLRMRVKQQQMYRRTQTARSQEVENMRNDIIEDVKENLVKMAAEEATKTKNNKSKNFNKKLKALEKKYGKISDELYQQTAIRYKTYNYQDESEKNHDRNLIALYLKQNKGKLNNNNSESDKQSEIYNKLSTIADKMILDDNDESVSSDLSI